MTYPHLMCLDFFVYVQEKQPAPRGQLILSSKPLELSASPEAKMSDHDTSALRRLRSSELDRADCTTPDTLRPAEGDVLPSKPHKM